MLNLRRVEGNEDNTRLGCRILQRCPRTVVGHPDAIDGSGSNSNIL